MAEGFCGALIQQHTGYAEKTTKEETPLNNKERNKIGL